jgi:hypothetical protein
MIPNSKQYCPNCGYEYEAWVEACPDCNSPLATPPPQVPPPLTLERNEDPRWTVVGNVPNAILGTLMKSQIEAAGIPVLMFRSPSADIAEFSHNDYVPHDLLVPNDRLSEARAIMDGTHSPGFWSDEWDDESDVAEISGENAEGASTSEKRLLPYGWNVFSGDQDPEERSEPAARREAPPPGWYWSDEPAGAEGHGPSEQQASQVGRVRRIPTEYARDESRHGSSGYSGDWYRPSRATKIIYAVLLLIMGLPFILQIMESIASFFNR